MDQREWLEIDTSTPSNSRFNVLPCAIKYNGRVDGTKFSVSGSPMTARFRGRPLEGKLVDLGALGYVGHTLVAEKPSQNNYDDDEDASDNESAELNEVRMVANGLSFDKIVVWEHGTMPASNDPWAYKLEDLLHLAKYL